ncbi:hypothetical protein [Arthrobacter sp. ZGTC412]|uniref:hypothetical protein n=1 Tax=Arthrobacter sp. ZGTC412 TaxID=2058900 RepID=UPI0015E2E9C8|nr:hypothetical protein [Arthrobacter sp. ZGTC412]
MNSLLWVFGAWEVPQRYVGFDARGSVETLTLLRQSAAGSLFAAAAVRCPRLVDFQEP